MTREIAWRKAKGCLYDALSGEEADEIIKALEQEPCADTISRQEVLDALDKSKYSNEFCAEHHIDWSINLGMAHIVVNELKPVKPPEKIGRWITWKEAGNEIPSETRFECSVCHDAAQTLCNGLDLLSSYCPNCGAKMQGEKE